MVVGKSLQFERLTAGRSQALRDGEGFGYLLDIREGNLPWMCASHCVLPTWPGLVQLTKSNSKGVSREAVLTQN